MTTTAMPSFNLRVLSSDGSPVAGVSLADSIIVDLDHLPRFSHKPRVGAGKATLPAPGFPFGVSARLPVQGFGDVWLYADNTGAGYRAEEIAGMSIDFIHEAAKSRIAAVKAAEQRACGKGLALSTDYRRIMDEARAMAEDAGKRQVGSAERSRLSYDALARALHAGEMLSLEQARFRIARRGARPGFRFGCNGFRYHSLGEPYARLFDDLLDFVTLPFYRGQTEKAQGSCDFSGVDKILAWAERDGLTPKGHPLMWFHRTVVPQWLQAETSFGRVMDSYRGYIETAVGRYRGRIGIWDVINEAHDWANMFGFGLDELVEATRTACDATRRADPAAIRVVNSCCTWSEYVAHGRDDEKKIGRQGRTVLQYVKDVIKAGVDFEAIGLQMYYPSQDLFEIDRHLDLFCCLGKPVHITELGVNSSCEPAPGKTGLGINPHYWHGRPWSETEQADWIEGYYTLCYAKPAIEAVSWWDFCDPAFVAHGGLVDAALRPKEGYRRLKGLINGWKKLPSSAGTAAA